MGVAAAYGPLSNCLRLAGRGGAPPTQALAGVKAGLSDKRVEGGGTLYGVYLSSGSTLASDKSAEGGALRRPIGCAHGGGRLACWRRRRDLGAEECHRHVRESVQEAHRILAA